MYGAAYILGMAVPVLLAAAGGVAGAQTANSTLPPAVTTGVQRGVGAGAQGAVAARRAEVQYTGGLLTVTARDVSLNSVLRQISQQTGMKISGGVRDERVFGTYGPDRPDAVLNTLLDGSGSNVLLINNAANDPAQLILSPRTGGPTPPGQFAAGRPQDQEADDRESQPPPPPGRFGAQSGPQQGAVGARSNEPPGTNLNPSLSTPSSNNSDSQAVVFPPVNATTTPATATTSSDVTEDTPGGVKTPQQIFEQLQKLRQQQEQAQPPDGTQ